MDKKSAMSMQTKQKLKETFLELYANRGISNITIGAITKKAGYNRSTFYNYYDDLNSMLDEIEDTVIEQIQTKISEILAVGIPEDVSMVFPLALSVFEEYGNTLYILLGKNGNVAFRKRLKSAVKHSFRDVFAGYVSAEQTEYVLTFIVSSGLGLIEHWYETGKKYSAEDFLRLSQSLIATGLFGQLQKDTDSKPSSPRLKTRESQAN